MKKTNDKKEFNPGFMDADAFLKGMKDVINKELKSGKITKTAYEKQMAIIQRGLDAPE